MRQHLLSALTCVLGLISLHAEAGDSDLTERLAACASCHGRHGEGVSAAEYFPHLTGKPVGYLLDQLKAFRDGRRHYTQMVWLVRNMDDAYMAEIAQFYAAMPPRTTPEQATTSVEPAMAARAQELVRNGKPSAGVPACSACHGEDLAGLEPGIPALVGLPAEFIVAQLGAWRNGVRQSREPDCMKQIALALDPLDVRALGDWLSTQGHADERRPAPAGRFVPPIACGELAHAERSP